MKVLRVIMPPSSGTSVIICQTKYHYITADSSLHSYKCENLKDHCEIYTVKHTSIYTSRVKYDMGHMAPCPIPNEGTRLFN
jgi:hypothetical protein